MAENFENTRPRTVTASSRLHPPTSTSSRLSKPSRLRVFREQPHAMRRRSAVAGCTSVWKAAQTFNGWNKRSHGVGCVMQLWLLREHAIQTAIEIELGVRWQFHCFFICLSCTTQTNFLPLIQQAQVAIVSFLLFPQPYQCQRRTNKLQSSQVRSNWDYASKWDDRACVSDCPSTHWLALYH